MKDPAIAVGKTRHVVYKQNIVRLYSPSGILEEQSRGENIGARASRRVVEQALDKRVDESAGQPKGTQEI